MKRFISLTLTVLIALSICTIASAEKYVVNTESTPLNIRLASDHSVILGGIAKGKTVNIDYFDKFWGYFTYDGQLACVYKSYLVKVGDSSTAPTTPSTSKPGPSRSSAPKKVISTNEASMIYSVGDEVKDCITVRAKKSSDAKILGRVYPGEYLYVVNVGSTWTRVVYDGQYGFVKTKYIVLSDYNLPEEGALYQVVVKSGTTLNVRASDTKKSDVLRALPNGAYVKVIEQYDLWSKIFYDMENQGFVMNKFIKPVMEQEE